MALQYHASKFANSSEHHLHNAPFLVNKRAVGNCNLAIATTTHLWVASESVIMTLRLHKNNLSPLRCNCCSRLFQTSRLCKCRWRGRGRWCRGWRRSWGRNPGEPRSRFQACHDLLTWSRWCCWGSWLQWSGWRIVYEVFESKLKLAIL